MLLKNNKTIQQRLKMAVVIIMAITVSYLCGNYYQHYKSNQTLPANISATLLNPPQDINQLNLLDQQGQDFKAKDLMDYWNLVFIGNPAPESEKVINKAISVFNEFVTENDLQKKIRFILIAKDAQVSQQDMLGYLPKQAHFFIGLTGQNKELKAIKDVLGYLDETHFIYLINNQGAFNAIFDSQMSEVEIAQNIKAIMMLHGDL